MVTVSELVRAFAERGDAPAVLAAGDDGAFECTRYGELHDLVRGIAAGLLGRGVTEGAFVLLWAPNGTAWVACYLGILAAGAVAVPLDDQAGGEVLELVLRRSSPRCVVTVRRHLAALDEAGLDEALPRVLLDAQEGDAAGWRELAGAAGAERPRNDDPTRPAALLYTSGTTGTPKGVPLTHANLLTNVRALRDAGIVSARDRVLLPLPMHHAYPATVGILTVLASGAAIVLPAGVSGPEITAAVRRGRVTILIGVPRLYEALLQGIAGIVRSRPRPVAWLFSAMLNISVVLRKHAGFGLGKLPFAALHRRLGPTLGILACGGAKLDARTAWRLEGLGWMVLTGYGLTETSPVVSFNTPKQRRLDSEGRPLPGVDLRIDKRAGEADGEVLVRGPNVFAGYYGDEVATRRAFTADGWFRTGDYGFLDEGGFLHVLGRRSEVIVLADGKKISPEPLERRYEASSYIREVALLARAGGLAALVVPDEDAVRRRGTISQATLLRDELDNVVTTLPSYQRIREYRIVRQGLPRTRLGKLRRHQLPDIFAGADAARERQAAAEPSADDRRLLEAPRAAAAWRWLEERYAEAGITLDASPQLDLGIDSLDWVSLTGEIEVRFGVALDAAALSRVLTVRDLLRAIQEAPVRTADAGRVPEEEGGEYLAPPPAPLRWVDRLVKAAVRSSMRLFRLRVIGADNLPAAGPFVIVANHASYLDPFAVAAALPGALRDRVCWAGWVGQTHRTAFRRLLSRASRVFPVNADQDLGQALQLAARVLRQGDVLVWFPEGRRSRDGKLHAFRRGIGVILADTPVPVVPARVDGSFAAWPPDKRWPRLRPLTLTFGAPETLETLRARGEGDDEAARIANALREAVAGL